MQQLVRTFYMKGRGPSYPHALVVHIKAMHAENRYSLSVALGAGSDIQEVIGTAIALRLLSGGRLPLYAGGDAVCAEGVVACYMGLLAVLGVPGRWTAVALEEGFWL